MDKVKLRFAEQKDAERLLEIYAPYVENEDWSYSDVSFEYITPSLEEFRGRITAISKDFPYIVLEKDGKILGYAYAHPYIQRAAYQWSAEVTIYLCTEGHGKGYGTLLYKALEEMLKLQGITNLYACIAYDNEASISFHGARGYAINGVFKQCAFKNGHWLDMVWMEKNLQEHKAAAELILTIDQIDNDLLEEILVRYSTK